MKYDNNINFNYNINNQFLGNQYNGNFNNYNVNNQFLGNQNNVNINNFNMNNQFSGNQNNGNFNNFNMNNQFSANQNIGNQNNGNINNFNTKNQNSENKNNIYLKKINELEKYIKELELKIKEKDTIINEEKIKNENLNKKIKDLENTSNKQNNATELENEIKLFRKYNNFSEGEKLISIKFTSFEQDVDYSLIIKNTELFSKIEAMLYNKYPRYIETDNYFFVNGIKVNRNKTFEKNNIKNNDIITLLINEDK